LPRSYSFTELPPLNSLALISRHGDRSQPEPVTDITMASKKGLSEAEKRTRMSEIFLSVFTKLYYEYSFQGDFFTFKEIEKIATQQKKIVLQSVKEILQSLVDDGLV
jgi:Mnd1 HTH domain